MPFDPDLEKAVAICKSDEPLPMKKHEQYEQIRKFANRQRQTGESIEKAVSRFITQDPDGRVLYKAFTKARGPQATTATGHNAGNPCYPEAQSGESGSDIDGPPSEGETEHMRALRILAATLRQKDPALSKAAAMAKALMTAEGATLYLRDKQARRVA
jgi:hypothetical protein